MLRDVHKIRFFFSFGATTSIGALAYLHETLFHFSLLDFRQVGRTPWMGDQLVARPLPVHKHRKTHTPNIHALSWIRTHGPGIRVSEDSARLRPLGYCDRHKIRLSISN
jgi:hypothetical protein